MSPFLPTFLKGGALSIGTMDDRRIGTSEHPNGSISLILIANIYVNAPKPRSKLEIQIQEIVEKTCFTGQLTEITVLHPPPISLIHALLVAPPRSTGGLKNTWNRHFFCPTCAIPHCTQDHSCCPIAPATRATRPLPNPEVLAVQSVIL